MPNVRIAPRRYTRRRRARKTPALLLVCAAVALVVGASAVALCHAAPGATASPAGEAAASTQRSEWRAGEVPHLYQTDPAWADSPYAGGTIRENGCGPTALAMAYVALTGRDDMGPVEMAAFAERGGYVSDGMSTWTLMSEGAAELGLTSEELPADEGSVRAALLAGHPVICSVRPWCATPTAQSAAGARGTSGACWSSARTSGSSPRERGARRRARVAHPTPFSPRSVGRGRGATPARARAPGASR